MQDASIRQFRNILTRNDEEDRRKLAEEAGHELGQALVMQDKLTEQLTKEQLEIYRRRYGVHKHYLNVMRRVADNSRREWIRYQEHNYGSRAN